MARWILLGMTILGTVVVFTTHNGVLLAIALLMTLVGFVGLVLSLAAGRIASTSRPELAMVSREDMMAMRKPLARPDADAADAAARNADRASAEELTRIRRAASCAGNAKDAQSSSRIGRRLHWRLA